MSEDNSTIPGLVSVVICAWNNWPDLEMTIQSALQQSYEPIEVIVVDNSSTDATPEEVPRRFGNRLRYIRQPNRECGGAYNAGFEVARGEFVQFVDGDDVLAPNKIAKQVQIFRANPELDIVYGDVRMFQTLGGAANWQDDAVQPEVALLSSGFDAWGVWTGIHALGMLFLKKALEKVGPWDESLYREDLDYWVRAAYAGCRFGCCPGSLMGFKRVRPGQKSADSSAMAHGEEAVWEKALGYVTREPYLRLVAAHLARCRFRMAVLKQQMTTRQALNKIALARATSPEVISMLAYAAGVVMIVLPGGAALAGSIVCSRRLRPILRDLARLFRYRLA